MSQPRVSSKAEWQEARKALLAREKQLTKLHDELAAARRELPWVAVEKDYVFTGQDGLMTLAQAFAGRSQLLVYHFMMGPDWQAGCKSCSFWCDHFSATLPHLAARDVALVAVARTDYRKIRAFADRMGWRFPVLSALDSEFNYDYGVSFRPEELESDEARYNFGTQKPHGEDVHGLSVFAKNDDGRVFHTYSTYARGVEALNTSYQALDLVPKGRDESELPYGMAWLQLHDEYA